MGGRILQEDIEAVRDATDIVALIGERVALKKSGRQFAGLCPFHTEKTASFYVSAEKGVYHCHGCNASGNVFRFLRDLDGLDFPETVEFLARKAGITLRYEQGGAPRGDDGSHRRRWLAAHEEAVAFYHHLFMKTDEGGTARAYWRQRGFSGADAEDFLVGFSPDDWDRLVRHLQGKGFAADVLMEAGLAVRSRTGRPIDRFRNRIMFPLHNQAGEPIGFGARALPGGADPKYLNSPESGLYAKSRVLYNLHRARGEILQRREAVVVEGYTDVIALDRAGLPNAVATCGTALGEPHLEVLRRYGSGTDPLRVVLAFDSDTAGRAAGERGFDLFGKFDLDLRAARFPEGSDPADVALTDPDRAVRAVGDAVPLMEFKLRAIIDKRPLHDPESRARALRAAVAALAVHPDAAARDGWGRWLAETLKIDKDIVSSELRRARAGAAPSRRGPAPAEPARDPARIRREAELVRVAVFGPTELAERARHWPADDLRDPRAAAALAALIVSSGSVPGALEGMDPEMGSYLARLTVEEPDVDDVPSWAKEVLHLLELDQMAETERALQVDDLDDLTRQIELIQRRHGLQGTP